MTSPALRAYSYIRFSTAEQLKGDSLRRQLELSEQYAKANNLVLDDRLTFRDIGVSAFDKSNLGSGGKLGEFLGAIESGHVAPGSVLLVESLDRLSRAKINDALKVFLTILDKGITIVTLSDGMRYAPTNDNSSLDFTSLIVSLAVMSRAHEESLTKSKRLSAAWSNKRNLIAEKKLTKLCPAWLKLNDQRTGFVLDSDRVAIVRQIVELVRSGQGKGAIARRLNAAGLESIGQRGEDRAWHESYITKIIKSRALVGEFQPHRMQGRKRVPVGEPIADYYPRIMTDEEFAVLQDLIRARGRHVGGNRGSTFSNLFSGLVRCGYCASTMVFVDKGIDKRGNRNPDNTRFLVCHRSKRGLGCHYVPWTYKDLETSFFTYAKRVDFEQFVSVSTNRTSELRAINDQITLLRSSIETLKLQVDRLVTAITESADPPAAILEKIVELSEKKTEAGSRLELLNAQRQGLVSRSQMSTSAVQALRDVADALAAKSGDELFLYRSRLNEYLRRVLDQILLFPGGVLKKTPEVEQLREAMISDGRWQKDEVEVFIDATVQTIPSKIERFFAIRSGESLSVVLPPAAVARDVLRRLKGYPDVLMSLLPTVVNHYTIAGSIKPAPDLRLRQNSHLHPLSPDN